MRRWLLERPSPPVGPPPVARDLITDHEFQRLEGWPRCVHVTVADGVGRPCDRAEEEHDPAGEIEVP